MADADEEAIFTEALRLAKPAARAAYLDAVCAGGAVLRARLEALLKAHEQGREFLARPVVEGMASVWKDAEEDGDWSLKVLGPPTRPDALGQLGRYDVLSALGRGGTGVVFRAVDPGLDRVVALKVLAPALAADPAARRRFAREARAAAAICHEHVVAVHAVEEAHEPPFLVMQYIDGGSLQDRLDRRGPVGTLEVLRLGSQAARGLASAHAQGLVHRDVKPANILLENGVERVKLSDFGLARATDDASLTAAGLVAGTPSYMAPEQADGRPVDHRADLFSLGAVLYACSVGKPPFRGDSTLGVLRQVCDSPHRPVREINPEVPDWLAAVIDRLLSKNPADRYASAAEVAERLGQCLALMQRGEPVTWKAAGVVCPIATPMPSPSTKRRWMTPAAVSAAVLLAGAGLSEATGVTDLSGTVIRLVRPDGVLVVEADDPNVSVSLDGDGVTVSGAGLREIRLRPGRHELKASRDGRVVRQELIEVTRGGRRVVRIGREPGSSETGSTVVADRLPKVIERLKALNPDFDGRVETTFDKGELVGLKLSADDVTDLAPLATLTSLRFLNCSGSALGRGKLARLNGLKGLELNELELVQTEVEDLTPLAGMPLSRLVLFRTKVADLSPLRRMPLSYLSIAATKVTDLSPLNGLPIENVNISQLDISDLRPLATSPLKQLWCNNTKVSDLSAIARLPLKALTLEATLVTDLAPLKEFQLNYLRIDPSANPEPLRGLPELREINDLSSGEFWKRYDATKIVPPQAAH